MWERREDKRGREEDKEGRKEEDFRKVENKKREDVGMEEIKEKLKR